MIARVVVVGILVMMSSCGFEKLPAIEGAVQNYLHTAEAPAAAMPAH